MKKRFGDNSFDIKILKRKCNQKCRDTNRRNAKKAELLPTVDEEVQDEGKEQEVEEEQEEDEEDDDDDDDDDDEVEGEEEQ